MNIKGKALGMIESYGYIGAVEASDVALKSAQVTLIDVEFVKGGLVTTKFVGDVGAVKAAVDAAEVAVKNLNAFVSSHVIARPSMDITNLLMEELEKKSQNQKLDEEHEIYEETLSPETNDNLEIEEKAAEESNEENRYTEDELEKIKVVKLRSIARELEGISLEKKEIKFANKKTLVDAILQYYEGKKE